MAKKEVLQQLKSDLRPSKKNLMFLVRISAKKQGSGAFKNFFFLAKVVSFHTV
jgi:hypothetical protein